MRPSGWTSTLVGFGVLVIVLLAGVLLGRATSTLFDGRSVTVLRVEPLGGFDSAADLEAAIDDDAIPDGSAAHPFGSLTDALKVAHAGDVIKVGPGLYPGPVSTVRSGTPDQPIIIRGNDAIIRGDRETSVLLSINHSHLVIEGFEISEAARLVTIRSATGVVLRDNTISGADAECVRLRDGASGNRIEGNDIVGCGRVGFDLSGSGRNGEGIYVGTAPEDLSDQRSSLPDRSDGNVLIGNRISAPAECVDIKEFSSRTEVLDNQCSGTEDPNSAGISSRGDGTILRRNSSQFNRGAGIRLGGDRDDQGIDAVVVGNRLAGNGEHGLRVVREPQRQICGNIVLDNDEGPVNRRRFDPTRPC